jgi:hypothetical protein
MMDLGPLGVREYRTRVFPITYGLTPWEKGVFSKIFRPYGVILPGYGRQPVPKRHTPLYAGGDQWLGGGFFFKKFEP